jgi:hypothetical protein
MNRMIAVALTAVTGTIGGASLFVRSANAGPQGVDADVHIVQITRASSTANTRTYHVEVSNNGSDSAYNTVLTFNAGTHGFNSTPTLISSSPAGVTASCSTAVYGPGSIPVAACTFSSLLDNSQDATFEFVVNATSQIAVAAQIFSISPDSDSSGNSTMANNYLQTSL